MLNAAYLLKRKLESVTGISPASQKLDLFRSQDDSQIIRRLDDEEKSLAEAGVQDGMLIKVRL